MIFTFRRARFAGLACARAILFRATSVRPKRVNATSRCSKSRRSTTRTRAGSREDIVRQSYAALSQRAVASGSSA
jgi:hypothetical protein